MDPQHHPGDTALELLEGHRPAAVVPFTTKFTPGQIQIIRNVYAKDLTDDEFVVFLYQSERRGLDPTTGQIHAVVRGRGEDRSLTIQTGIAGFRLISQRTGRDRGRLGPLWCGKDGVWKDVWLSKDHPYAAKVGVRTTNNPEGSWAVVTWDEVAQKTRDGKLNRFWDTMGPTMIAKCAEAAVRRVEFPEELSGLYIDEEISEREALPPLSGQTERTTWEDDRTAAPRPSTIPPQSPLKTREMALWREATALHVPLPPLTDSMTEDRRVARCDWIEARIAFRKLTNTAEKEYQIPVPKLADRVTTAQIKQATADLQKMIDAAPKLVGENDELFPTDETT